MPERPENHGTSSSTPILRLDGLHKRYAQVQAVDGLTPSEPHERKPLGLAPQAFALYEDLTGEENLRFFGALQGMARTGLEARVGWTIEFAGLADCRRDRVRGYSGEMKRRLSRAVALMHDPELRAQGSPVVYPTHNMEERERPYHEEARDIAPGLWVLPGPG